MRSASDRRIYFECVEEDQMYEGSLSGLVEWAEEIVASIPEQFRAEAFIEPEGGGYTGEHFRMEISIPMSDDEAEELTSAQIASEEARERATLERLLLKYGSEEVAKKVADRIIEQTASQTPAEER